MRTDGRWEVGGMVGDVGDVGGAGSGGISDVEDGERDRGRGVCGETTVL